MKIPYYLILSCVIAQPDDFTYSVGLNSDGKALKFQVECPEDTWFGIVYKFSMINSDVVRFICSGDGSVEDLYSTGYKWPDLDSS